MRDRERERERGGGGGGPESCGILRLSAKFIKGEQRPNTVGKFHDMDLGRSANFIAGKISCTAPKRARADAANYIKGLHKA